MPAIGGFLGWNEPPPAAMNDDLRLDHLVGVGPDAEQRAVRRAEHFEPLDHLVEMKGRRERMDLLHQIVDQPLAGDDRKAGNVVDRLLRIEFGALAADLGQDVDQMAP